MRDDDQNPAGKPDSIPGNVFLVGLMGAGKTSVGRLLARRLGKSFFDCDHEIERATGVKIAVIFDIEGEAGFRARESKALGELVKRSDIVLATGGGAVLLAANRALLVENGVVVYLHAAVADLWRRTRHDKNRPLLRSDDPLTRLRQLFDERDPLYREVSDVVVDTSSQSASSLANRLEQLLRQHSGAGGRESAPLRAG